MGENPSVTEFLYRLALSYQDIGYLQNDTGRPTEALASWAKALEIQERLVRENPSVTEFQSQLATIHGRIGSLQSEIGRPAEALESKEKSRVIWERLVHENPESPDFAGGMGLVLGNMAVVDIDDRRFHKARGMLLQAVELERKAFAANPNSPIYRRYLDTELQKLIRAAKGLGRADEADQAKRELDELRRSDPQIAALDARLTAVLNGKEIPHDDVERLQLAWYAFVTKSLHARAVRLYAEALANDPRLADDRRAQYAYNAACAAALAASGQGKDDPPADDAAKGKLRRQASKWLQAELSAWAKVVETGTAEMKAQVAPALQHWKEDTDLIGIRDENERAKLPEDERTALKTLWNDVDQLLIRAVATN